MKKKQKLTTAIPLKPIEKSEVEKWLSESRKELSLAMELQKKIKVSELRMQTTLHEFLPKECELAEVSVNSSFRFHGMPLSEKIRYLKQECDRISNGAVYHLQNIKKLGTAEAIYFDVRISTSVYGFYFHSVKIENDDDIEKIKPLIQCLRQIRPDTFAPVYCTDDSNLSDNVKVIKDAFKEVDFPFDLGEESGNVILGIDWRYRGLRLYFGKYIRAVKNLESLAENLKQLESIFMRFAEENKSSLPKKRYTWSVYESILPIMCYDSDEDTV